MDRMKAVGNRLKEARGNRTRAEIAGKAGISLSAVQMYEDGKRVPRDAIKIKLARVLGKSVEELFYPDFF